MPDPVAAYGRRLGDWTGDVVRDKHAYRALSSKSAVRKIFRFGGRRLFAVWIVVGVCTIPHANYSLAWRLVTATA